MSQARGPNASRINSRGMFSERGLNCNIDSVVDKIVFEHTDAIRLEDTGGLSRIYAPSDPFTLIKAITGGTLDMARREARMQKQIAQRTAGLTIDGEPIVPSIHEYREIPFLDYALDLLEPLLGIELPPEQLQAMNRDGSDLVGILGGAVLKVDDKEVDLEAYLTSLQGVMQPVLRMETLWGGDDIKQYLEDRKKENPMTMKEMLKLSLAITDALGVFHRSGHAHMDIKPANIYVQELEGGDYAVKFLDCGNARPIGEQLPKGILVATQNYASPEHIYALSTNPEDKEKAVATEQSDIFALGQMLHSIFRGGSPIKASLNEAVRSYASGRGGKISRQEYDKVQFFRLYNELTGSPHSLHDGSIDAVARETYLGPLGKNLKAGGLKYLQTADGIVDNLLYHCMRLDPQARPQSCAEVSLQLSRAVSALEGKYQSSIPEHQKITGPKSGLIRIEDGMVFPGSRDGSVDIDLSEFECEEETVTALYEKVNSAC